MEHRPKAAPAPAPDPDSDQSRRSLIASLFLTAGLPLNLARGETLMRQGAVNERLYLVEQGCLRAYGTDETGEEYELFRAGPQRLVGVYSFFSGTYRSLLTVVAEEDSRLRYIERPSLEDNDAEGAALLETLMPAVVAEWTQRQGRTLELARDQERTFQKLLHSQKLASLGQMAADVAHELNNAVAVLERNTQWLAQNLEALATPSDEAAALYRRGLELGVSVSTRQVRERARHFQQKLGLEAPLARSLAEAGVDEAQAAAWAADPSGAAVARRLWRAGTALNHMLGAAAHAAHVIKSARTMGQPDSGVQPDVDLNDTVHQAVTLLHSALRPVEVNLHLEPLPPLAANSGELVQVWSNLIRNACESLHEAATPQPRLDLRSRLEGQDVVVEVGDNGPGICPDLLPQIFQPGITTKAEGQSGGMGLGLTIVQRLVEGHRGRVGVKSAPGRTVFEVVLPLGAG